MFEKLFGGRKQPIVPDMPAVEVIPDIEGLFEKARQAAGGEGPRPPGSEGGTS